MKTKTKPAYTAERGEEILRKFRDYKAEEEFLDAAIKYIEFVKKRNLENLDKTTT